MGQFFSWKAVNLTFVHNCCFIFIIILTRNYSRCPINRLPFHFWLQFFDDVEYLLDGLKQSCSIATRCLSALDFASHCSQPSFRVSLRAHGIAPKIFSALQDAPSDKVSLSCLDEGVLHHPNSLSYMYSYLCDTSQPKNGSHSSYPTIVGGRCSIACLTPVRLVWVWALTVDIVLCSWAKHFTLKVPLSTQVYSVNGYRQI